MRLNVISTSQVFVVFMLIKGSMSNCIPRCQNGGQCVRDMCLCRANYTGYRCQFDMTQNNACMSAPCQHGGTCARWAYDYVCYCPKGYGGTQCEYSDIWYGNTASTLTSSSDGYNPLGVLLGVVMSLVAVAAVLGAISWWRISRRRQLRHAAGRSHDQSRRDSGRALRLGSVSSSVGTSGYGVCGGFQQPTESGPGDGQHWANSGPICGPYDPAVLYLPPAYSLAINEPKYSPEPPPSYEESFVTAAAADREDAASSAGQSVPTDPQPQDGNNMNSRHEGSASVS